MQSWLLTNTKLPDQGTRSGLQYLSTKYHQVFEAKVMKGDIKNWPMFWVIVGSLCIWLSMAAVVLGVFA
jgi:hypothetical protein